MNEREQTSRARTGAFCLAGGAMNDNATGYGSPAPSLLGHALARDALVAVMPHPRIGGIARSAGVGSRSVESWCAVDPFELEASELAKHSPLEVLSLSDAFARSWPTDAHMVSGVLAMPSGDPAQRQPRVNKGAYDDLFARGYRLRFQVVFVDSDRNDKPAPWSDEARAHAQRVLDEAPELEGCAWHFTRGGLHIIGALANPTEDPLLFECMLRAFQARVAPALARIPTPPTANHPAPYMMPDAACSDWTRTFRLPRVQREAKGGAPRPPRESHSFDLARLRPLSLEVDASNAARAGSRYRPGTFGTFGADYDREAPAEWAPHVEALGRACASGRDALDAADSWNALFNALAGALCDGGVALRSVPAIIGAIASAAGDDSERRIRECGVDTARKYSHALPVIKTQWLEAHRPDVAREVARVLALLQLGATGALPTAADVWERARAWVRTRPLASCVLKLGTGIGKTELAIDCAREAAIIGRDEHGHAKRGAKTGITVPTHKLAIEVAERARRVGLPVVRMFSPPSLVNADDSPVCKLYERATVIADAGLSVPYELCQGRGIAPCEHRDGCAAADGTDGDEAAALVFIGTHERLPAIASGVGSHGTVFVDEPPDTVREHSIALDALEALADEGESGRGIFVPSYADALGAVVAPLLEAARDAARWTRTADGGELVQRLWPVAELVPADALERFAAVEAEHGPPLRGAVAGFMRMSDDAAGALVGRCSLAALLHRIAARPWMNEASNGSRAPRWTASVPLDRRTGELAPSLVFTGAPAHIEDSLAAMPRAVFMDAAPDLEALSRAVGAPFAAAQLFEGLACDADRVTRTVIHCRASRTRLVNEGAPVVEEVAGVLQRAIAWALEEPDAAGLALFSYLPVIAAVDLAAGIDSRAARSLSPAVAVEVRERLAPVLARWTDGGRRSVMTGHYGALRGRDGFKGNDAFVTIGDAQSNLDAVGRVARHLGAESGARGEWLAARELEQAHGRARFPRRSKPARALHIGTLWPLGAGWDRAEWRFANGRVEVLSPGEALAAVEAHGSQREAARALRVDEATVRRALARGPAAKGGREETPSTTPFRRTSPAGIETQSAAQNPRRSGESSATVTGGVSGPISDRPAAARVGRPLLAPAARMEASAMTTDELELAVLKLTRNRNRAELAVLLGCSERTLSRYTKGERAIPPEIAAKVRELLEVAA